MNKKSRSVSAARESAQSSEVNGRIYLILYRNTNSDPTDICPFCGEKHIHGKPDGHRVRHCNSTDSDYVIGRKATFKNSEGQIFDSENGYILKSRR
ncbi:hypothetical protein [Colwellia echini]|uniref:Transposase n=1 Tax=Colwellia echini TaxID=1982103 RepID=A0ABY3MYD4_9GAMM|nr:hypothetical protein [Colwellia echini]TYK66022.1 hypothetical protein CWS31_007040 [Colwellia echini]